MSQEAGRRDHGTAANGHSGGTGSPGGPAVSSTVQLKAALHGLQFAEQESALVPAEPRTSPRPGVQSSAQSGPVHGGLVQRRAVQRVVQREVKFNNDVGTEVTIPDWAGSGDEKTSVEECLGNIASGKPYSEFDWVKESVANNGNKESGSVKEFGKKWGSVHRNGDGLLPGLKGAGGYKEYYCRQNGTGISPVRRVVKKDAGGTVFFTNTHYGRDGAPAFYHIA
jgi:hypothetical protein